MACKLGPQPPCRRLSCRPWTVGPLLQAQTGLLSLLERKSQDLKRGEPVPTHVLLSPAGSYEDRCTFTDYANWVVPGHVMLGRYPYVEPSRCR